MSDSAPSPATPPRVWWRWINWLALDAVAVAVAWLYVFAKMTGARLRPVMVGEGSFSVHLPMEALLLGTAVWVVYMADRMIDAGTSAGAGGRHRFAGKHARWLVPVMAAVTAGAVWWALHDMRWISVKAALRVGAAVGVYFLIVLASRWKDVSQLLLMGVSALLLMGLVQGEPMTAPGLQLWRAVVAGILATVLYIGLRHQYDPPPWTLTKKWIGGYLFALGVAVVPFSRVEDWNGLLHGTPVVLFGAACALNSIGIRLWENAAAPDKELAMLGRLYPWLLAAVGGGALAQSWAADEWTRPVLWGVAACAGGFALLHFQRGWPAAVRSLAADGLMVGVALLVRWAGMGGLP